MQRGTNPVVAETISRAREAIGATERRRDNAANRDIERASREYLAAMRQVVNGAGRDRALLAQTAQDLAEYIDERGPVINARTLDSLKALRDRASTRAGTIEVAGEKKRERQKVNQDARDFYKELRSVVLQAGAGSTPDERSALTTTAHAVERYIDQNGQLLNKKVMTDFQALRHRCERLAASVQVPVRDRAESGSGNVSISTAAGSGRGITLNTRGIS